MDTSSPKPLRNIRKMQSANDGTRTLFESVMAPEVLLALQDWTKSGAGERAVLIGGLAMSFYGKPRYTQDVDFLLLSDTEIPETVPGFKRTRAHAFEHKKTGVEVEIVTADHVSTPAAVIQAVIASARVVDGIRVASPSGIVATKLFRFSRQDQADIEVLVTTNDIDVSNFSIPQEQIAKYVVLVQEIDDAKDSTSSSSNS